MSCVFAMHPAAATANRPGTVRNAVAATLRHALSHQPGCVDCVWVEPKWLLCPSTPVGPSIPAIVATLAALSGAFVAFGAPVAFSGTTAAALPVFFDGVPGCLPALASGGATTVARFTGTAGGRSIPNF